MSAAPESDPLRENTGHRGDSDPDVFTMPNWRVAVMDLIASRISLIQLEAKDLAGRLVLRVVMIVAAWLS